MKRFLLFIGLRYYAEGGWNEFVLASDDQSEIQRRINEATQNKKPSEFPDWYHVVDLQSGEIIQRGNF